MNAADMLLFAVVVREGSFTRAAASVGLTKQTVSERVAKLEQRLGVRLLERTTRRLRTTDAGATYYVRCSAIAAQIDDANHEVRQRIAEPTGRLRVTAPVLYGRRFLAPVVAEYLRRHSSVRVEVVLADRQVNLVEEGVDLAIRVGGDEDSSLVARKLGEAYVYYVASPTFLREHDVRTPASLRTARCIGLRDHETWSTGGKVLKIEPVLVVNDLELACDAAVAGIGVARVPALLCSHPVRSGKLRVLFGVEPAHVRSVYAVYPSRQHLPPKVRIFIETLARRVAPMRALEADART